MKYYTIKHKVALQRKHAIINKQKANLDLKIMQKQKTNQMITYQLIA